jgi:pilus assembly protein Flp/PilA
MMDYVNALWLAVQARLEAALRRDDEGQTLVEYALILVLIAIVVIIVLTLVGTNVNNIFNRVATTLNLP